MVLSSSQGRSGQRPGGGPAARERPGVLQDRSRSALGFGCERGSGDRGRGGCCQGGRLQELAGIDGFGHATLLVERSAAETIGMDDGKINPAPLALPLCMESLMRDVSRAAL